jgi:hypothetical protein
MSKLGELGTGKPENGEVLWDRRRRHFDRGRNANVSAPSVRETPAKLCPRNSTMVTTGKPPGVDGTGEKYR